jgi:hypothetical protein
MERDTEEEVNKGLKKVKIIRALHSLANKRGHKHNWGCVLSNYKLGFHGTS